MFDFVTLALEYNPLSENSISSESFKLELLYVVYRVSIARRFISYHNLCDFDLLEQQGDDSHIGVESSPSCVVPLSNISWK